MERLEAVLYMLDHSLNTKTKRHMVGGVLMSVSLFFGGLAITIITMKSEEQDNAQYIE
jgi:hypothetical protein